MWCAYSMDEAERRLRQLFPAEHSGARIVRREDRGDDVQKFFVWNVPALGRDVIEAVEDALPGARVRVFVTGEFGPNAAMLEVDLSTRGYYAFFAVALAGAVLGCVWAVYNMSV